MTGTMPSQTPMRLRRLAAGLANRRIMGCLKYESIAAELNLSKEVVIMWEADPLTLGGISVNMLFRLADAYRMPSVMLLQHLAGNVVPLPNPDLN